MLEEFNSNQAGFTEIARAYINDEGNLTGICDHLDSQDDFVKHIENVLNDPTEVRQLRENRSAYWHQDTNTVVIKNPKDPDLGTAFQPDKGKAYFNDLK